MIVNVEDLKDYMSGIGLKADQEVAAEFVLKGIQKDLERYLHRFLEPRLVTESVRVNGDGSLRTTHDPIVGVPSGSSFVPRGGRLYAASGITNQTFLLGDLGAEQFVEVSYIAGYNAREEDDTYDEFADVRLAIMRVAAREMTNRHDDTLSVKGLETDNVGEPTGPQNGVQGWTFDELRAHDRLRKRVIV